MLRPLLLLALLSLPVCAQTTQDKVRDYHRANEPRILQEYLALLAIPNVASDTANIRKNAEFIAETARREASRTS